MTFSQIIVIGVLGIIFAVIGLLIGLEWDDGRGGIIGVLIAIIITIIIFAITYWFNHNTASGVRLMKDWHSEMNNGIKREITITAEDGREIFHYKGKVDVESNHEDNYIKFEGEDGKRYIIYYGIQDTIKIIEVK